MYVRFRPLFAKNFPNRSACRLPWIVRAESLNPALRAGQPKREDAAEKEKTLTRPELHYRPSHHGGLGTVALHRG